MLKRISTDFVLFINMYFTVGDLVNMHHIFVSVPSQKLNFHHLYISCFGFCVVLFMVFNATFNNISVILWRSVLLVEEIGVPGENL